MNNPFYYHPSSAMKQAAGVVFSTLHAHPEWFAALQEGKMLGLLRIAPPAERDECVHEVGQECFLVAYSGVCQALPAAARRFFVPPIYDLSCPDDFYVQGDKAITALNHRLSALAGQLSTAETLHLKQERARLSEALQRDIFAHFVVQNASGERQGVTDLFAAVGRGWPPGGTGECAAPRLLHYAHTHGWYPVEIGECWIGASPRRLLRVSGNFYPSCVEKCAPLLRFLLPAEAFAVPPAVASSLARCTPTVVYEDEAIVVVNKPAGLLSVPSKDGHDAHVEGWLHARYPAVRGPMLLHRLDQATSGLLLAAKEARIHKTLQQALERREIHKEYLALVRGDVHCLCGLLALPLLPNPQDRPRSVVDFQFGKTALTRFERLSPHSPLLAALPSSTTGTWLLLTPLTGRTHQLRIHLASPFGLNTPIVGDALYGDDTPAPRLMLHAFRLSFLHPVTGQRLRLEATM